MKVARTVDVSPLEIAEAIHDARSVDVYEIPALVLRDGRWRRALILFESEDREGARMALAAAPFMRDPSIRFDARRLRLARTEKARAIATPRSNSKPRSGNPRRRR